MFILVDDVAALHDMIILIIAWLMIYDSTTVIITQPIIISCSGFLLRRAIISRDGTVAAIFQYKKSNKLSVFFCAKNKYHCHPQYVDGQFCL
jgi:hypothetical protein